MGCGKSKHAVVTDNTLTKTKSKKLDNNSASSSDLEKPINGRINVNDEKNLQVVEINENPDEIIKNGEEEALMEVAAAVVAMEESKDTGLIKGEDKENVVQEVVSDDSNLNKDHEEILEPKVDDDVVEGKEKDVEDDSNKGKEEALNVDEGKEVVAANNETKSCVEENVLAAKDENVNVASTTDVKAD